MGFFTLNMKSLALVVVFLFAFSSFAFAMSAQSDSFGDVTISRVYPESAYIGQKIWITIAIENSGASDKTLTITEKLGDAEFDNSGATNVPTTYGTMYLYEWEISLPAGENTSVSYWIIPKSTGNYVISPSEIVIDATEYRLKSAVIAVSCLIDKKCDSQSNENFLNCPQDCQSGGADGVCDVVTDSKCDPDCAFGADSDCKVLNGTIDVSINQTTNTTQPITNLTQTTNQSAIESKANGSSESVGNKTSEKGFDLGANAIFIIVIAAIAVAIVFWMRRKK